MTKEILPLVLELKEAKLLYTLSEKYNIPINDNRLQSLTEEQVILFGAMTKKYSKSNSSEEYYDDEFEDEQNKAEEEDRQIDTPEYNPDEWEDI